MQIKINVTANDIKFGKPDKCSLCPVARAIKREGFKAVKVYDDIVDLTYKETKYSVWAVINLPKFVARKINAFDNGRKITPFSFVLKVPYEA